MRDIVVVGPPSPLVSGSFAFLERALKAVYPGLTVLRLDRLDDIDDSGRPNEVRLILSTFPPPALATYCDRLKLRPIVLLDEMLPSVAFTRAGGTVPSLNAVRIVSAGLTLTGACSQLAGAHLVRRADDVSLLDLLTLAAGSAESAPNRARLEKACELLGGPDRSLRELVEASEAKQNASELTAEDEQLAECVLGGLYNYAVSGRPGPTTWPGRTFLLGDDPGTPAPVVMDVTGRARIIFYGPYFHLPRGRWKMRISYGFSHDIRGLPLNIQVASTSVLSELRVLAERGGIFAVDHEVVVTDPHQPIEIRTMNEQAAIEGHVALASVELTYLDLS